MKRVDHERIQSVLDGTASEIEFHHFQDALRQDAELRKLYQSYALLHHSLAEEFEGQALAGVARAKRTKASAVSGWMTGLLSAAAALAITATAIWLAARHHPADPGLVAESEISAPREPVEIRFSPEAAWRVEGDVTTRDAVARALPGTRVFLDKGVARCQFPNEVVGHVEAPAELVYEATGRVRLAEGKARFQVGEAGHGFTVVTSSLEAVDLGTEFAVISHQSAPDELHVFDGKVEMRTPEGRDRPLLVAGDAASVSGDGRVTRIAARPMDFVDRLPTYRIALEDEFSGGGGSLHGRLPARGRGAWEVRAGTAVVASQGVIGGGFEAFCRLDGPTLGPERPLLVATLELGATVAGPMHGPGWAGLSLFSQGIEKVFFGDSFGDDETWSLDVKQGIEPLLPEPKVVGPRVVTMVYDWRTGVTTLHSGDRPGGPELVRGRIEPRLPIDEVRLGASNDATINARRVLVRLLDSTGA